MNELGEDGFFRAAVSDLQQQFPMIVIGYYTQWKRAGPTRYLCILRNGVAGLLCFTN